MRLFKPVLLFLSLFASVPLAAGSPPSSEVFRDFYARQKSSAPVVLKEFSYRTVTSAPRDYSVVVLLTALEQRLGCKACRDFHPEWEVLARSWSRGDRGGESGLIFATLDFSAGREVFASLNLQTAPVIMLFPPTTGPHASESPDPVRYDFAHAGFAAEGAHKWIARHLPGRPHPPVSRPIDWFKTGTLSLMITGLLTAVFLAAPYILPVVQNRNVWAVGVLIAILFFTGGIMFNSIRKVPYVVSDGRGGISYIAAGFQSQYGLETQIIAALYGALAFCTVGLAHRVPRMVDRKTQQVAVFAWGIALFVLYSFLMSIFRVKNGGYPFSLPPFM